VTWRGALPVWRGRPQSQCCRRRVDWVRSQNHRSQSGAAAGVGTTAVWPHRTVRGRPMPNTSSLGCRRCPPDIPFYTLVPPASVDDVGATSCANGRYSWSGRYRFQIVGAGNAARAVKNADNYSSGVWAQQDSTQSSAVHYRLSDADILSVSVRPEKVA